MNEELELFDHQPEVIERFNKQSSLYCTDAMGLGKTVEVLNASKWLEGPILIVCRPLSMRQWEEEIRKWDGQDVPIVRAGVGGIFDDNVVSSWFKPVRKRGYLLIHHEALRLAKDMLKVFGVWEAIVPDEAHRFRNADTKMSKALKDIPTKRKWALSGSPTDRHAAEMWNILNWFSPREFGSYWSFRQQFVDEYFEPRSHRRVIVGVKNPELLKKVVGPWVLGRTKAQVAPNMVKKLVIPVPLEMTDDQKAVYDSVDSMTFAEIMADSDQEDDRFYIPNQLARIYALQRITLQPALIGSAAAGVKMPWLHDLLETYEDEQFVIFSPDKAFIKYLAESLKSVAVVHGDMHRNEDRLDALDKFKSDKVQVLAGTIDVMNESVSLENAHNVVFMGVHRSGIMMTQAEDRVHRIVSRMDVNVYRPYCVDTVDERLWAHSDKKINDSQLIKDYIGGHHPNTRLMGEAMRDVFAISGMTKP